MIRIDGLWKWLGGDPVLAGVDLRIDAGELVVLVGPSGTGKSVLLKHIAGILVPDAGDVTVDGRSVPGARGAELARLRAGMGYAFQDAALLDSLTVRDNLRLALDDRACRADATLADRRIAEALDYMNLDDSVLSRLPNELSGGMRKRVGVARAIIHRPSLVLYDEPTTGLDPRNVHAVNDAIRVVRHRLGATSLVVSHDLGSLSDLTDRVVLLLGGVVRFDGRPDMFFESTDEGVVSFLGARSANPRRIRA